MVQISPMVTLVSMAETLGFMDILKVVVLNHNPTLEMVSTTEILAAVFTEEMM